MLSVRALLGGCDLLGNEASSSLGEPPKVKIGFFFFSTGCALRPRESACSLDDSLVEEERKAKTPVFAKAVGFWVSAAAISALRMEGGALRRGTDRYDELTCAGEKPLTTLVLLLFDVPLVVDSDDASCAEVAEATGVSSTVRVFRGCGVALYWV